MAPQHVLVVDDELDQRKICEAILQHAGYRVLHAHNGTAAIQVAQEQQPGVILMDLRLPDLSGVEVLRELRRHEGTMTIPVVAMTADIVRYPDGVARSLGFAGYLAKPILPSRIAEEVRRLIGPAQPEVVAQEDGSTRPK